MTSAWAAPYLTGGAWLHTIIWHDRDEGSGFVLPNGRSVPPDFYADDWYQLDAEQRTVTVVSLMRDSSQQIVQAGTYQNGYWRNTATLDEPPWPGEPGRMWLDFHFVGQLEDALREGLPVYKTEQAAADGRLLATFGFRTKFSVADIQMTVDRTTGQILWLDTFDIQADGAERLSEHVELRVVENATLPPTDIQAYLDASTIQTVSDVTMFLTHPRQEGEHFYIDVCHDRPDDGNWLMSGGMLDYRGQILEGIRAKPIELRDWPVDGRQFVRHWDGDNYYESWDSAGPDAKGRRCDTLDFEVEPGHESDAFTLTIQSLKLRAGDGAEGNGKVIEGPWVLSPGPNS